MKELFATAAEDYELMCDFRVIDSISEDADECWLTDNVPPVVDALDDEASRDSGICLTDATSTDDNVYHDFSFTIFETDMPTEDSFSELKSGATLTSLPVPVSSPVVAMQSTPRSRSRTSRTLTFDDCDSNTPPRRHSGLQSAARPVLTARRRIQRSQPSSDPLPRTSTARHDQLPQSTPDIRCSGDTTSSVIISSCLEDEDERADLIGDLTSTHLLPLETNLKHADLKSISPHTMADVLNGKYADVIDELLIIDCRYPYEYDGGHISGARNICTKDDAVSQLLTSPPETTSSCQSTTASKRTVLIFHCEFSSERAPKLLRFLRNEDRKCHANCYPRLSYPEIYLLAGGYKAFYESYSSLCRPCSYRPMLHADHTAELRHFRQKSKTWSDDRKHQRHCAPRSTAFTRRHTLVL